MIRQLGWWGALTGLMVLAHDVTDVAAAGCSHACPASQRDPKGCCPVKPPPPPPVTDKKKVTKKGTKKTTKTTTTTPTTTEPVKTVPKISCPDGLAAVGEQCCWLGQKWSADAAMCQGTPSKCPPGTEVAGDTCAIGAVKSTHDANGLDWASFPRAMFVMGSREGAVDAQPPHRVIVNAFQLTLHEVTVAEYGACAKVGRCSLTGLGKTEASNWGKPLRASHPINDVTWEQAKAFCTWAGGRLPTEAEWELAARAGGRNQSYPWGNDDATCELAVLHDGDLAGCRKESTWPVCSRAPGTTVQGVCDLAGNVAEWVADRYAKDSYATSPAENPTGPATGSERVVRGGNYFHPDPRTLRTFHRLKYAADARYPFVGFRCAK